MTPSAACAQSRPLLLTTHLLLHSTRFASVVPSSSPAVVVSPTVTPAPSSRRRNRQSRDGESGSAKKEPSRVLTQISFYMSTSDWDRCAGLINTRECLAFLLRDLDISSPKEQEFTVTLCMNADAESVHLRRTPMPCDGQSPMSAKLRAVRAPWPWRRVGGAREVKFEGVTVGIAGYKWRVMVSLLS